MLFPFPKFRPDQSVFSPEASALIQNCRPTKDGVGPLKSLVAISDALPSAPRGGISVKTDARAFKTFAGTATNLYVLDSSAYTWSEKSVSTDAYSLADGVFWDYARFGNYLIATAVGSTTPQFVSLDTSDDFAALTGANFEAEIVAIVGSFVVFGCIDGDRRALKWSGVEDMNFWTVGQRGSDEQVLPDGGEIQAIIPQAQNAIIVQENCIRSMMFDPESGLVFRFTVIDPERGAFARRSVVNIGPGDFVFLAKDGFYRWTAGAMIPIGAERVDKFFFDNCASDKYDLVSGAADPFDKIVKFRFESAGGVNSILSYDWQLDEWGYETNNALDIFPAATAGLTLTELEALYGTIAGMPYPIGSRFYQGGIPGLGGFTDDFELGFFDGPNLEATIRTERKALNYPRRAITNRIRVMADTNDATVALATAETQDGLGSFGSAMSRQSGLPFINSRTSGFWHQAEVVIPAGSIWKNAVGLDIEFTDGGAR